MLEQDVLLDLLARKDNRAYQYLYQCYYVALKALANHYVKDNDVAEDLVQDVFISLLESDKDDIEHSIDGMMKYLSSHKYDKVYDDAIVSERQRKEIIASLQTVRNTLYDIQQKEYEMIPFSGEQYTPSEVADFVCENREEMSYIPGEIAIGVSLPVSVKSLEFLYQLNNSMTREQELELLYGLPNPEDFMSPETFAKNTAEKNS